MSSVNMHWLMETVDERSRPARLSFDLSAFSKDYQLRFSLCGWLGKERY
jgi:hypothetical protein